MTPISAAVAATIVSCFAPEQNCALLVIGAIEVAQREILVNAYAFTTVSGIPGALIRAHDRGVDVRLIADKWTPCEQREGLTPVAAAGIPVWIDARARIAHEKALIIDRGVTIMGSYNFSAVAALNSADLNVVTSPEVAEAYAARWPPQGPLLRNGARDDPAVMRPSCQAGISRPCDGSRRSRAVIYRL